MRRSNTQNISTIITDMLKEFRIDDKLREVRLINAWEEVLGTKIARSTSNIYIANRVLFVHFNSSIIRNELLMLKSSIVKTLNDKAGASVIDDIVMR